MVINQKVTGKAIPIAAGLALGAGASVLISTHLISDVENVLDGYIFLHEGKVVRTGHTAQTREETGKTLDELFREVFRCLPNC